MNACVATGHQPADYTKYFDTVSICFSKGLGAPVGSAVASTKETVRRVHRFRKMFGGGMRQAGIIAAGALYALERNIPRLVEDHENARRLAEALANIPGVMVDPGTVETNIVIFDIAHTGRTPADFVARLKAEGILASAIGGTRVRVVTHYDVSRADCERAAGVIHTLMRKERG